MTTKLHPDIEAYLSRVEGHDVPPMPERIPIISLAPRGTLLPTSPGRVWGVVDGNGQFLQNEHGEYMFSHGQSYAWCDSLRSRGFECAVKKWPVMAPIAHDPFWTRDRIVLFVMVGFLGAVGVLMICLSNG